MLEYHTVFNLVLEKLKICLGDSKGNEFFVGAQEDVRFRKTNEYSTNLTTKNGINQRAKFSSKVKVGLVHLRSTFL